MRLVDIVLVAAIAIAVIAIFGSIDNDATRVTNFEKCVAAGNPVIEKPPKRCTDSDTGMLFFEDDENVGEACISNEDCRTPMGYAIQSNCPFGAACIDSKCSVVCPLVYYNPDVSESFVCEADSDCDCSWYDCKPISIKSFLN